jgi:DNA invertase Pin-like site-specific DNA recombinase
MRAAVYARVSTVDQQPEKQLAELRRYALARGWEVKGYVDHGVSGAKERRPALDEMMADAKRRRFDAVVCWRLDRLGRNLRHLITMLDELRALGIAFVSLAEGIDATTPAGKLQLHILAAIAEFERGHIQERVRAGLVRAKAQGKRLGRPKTTIPTDKLMAVVHLSSPGAALALGVSQATIRRWRAAQKTRSTAA